MAGYARGVLVGLIRLYQVTWGHILPPSCRFVPTCAAYAEECVRRFGVRGLRLAAARILRCHPWAAAGLDPVPEEWPWRRG